MLEEIICLLKKADSEQLDIIYRFVTSYLKERKKGSKSPMKEQKNSALAAATAQDAFSKKCITYRKIQVQYTPSSGKSQGLLDDECWPTVWETMQAEEVFRAMLEHEGKARVNSPQMCVKLAVIEVWRQGRIYQKRRETR